MKPQSFISRLDASESFKLCTRRFHHCQTGSILLLWIKFGPVSVSYTVLSGTKRAPLRPAEAEILKVLFAK